MGLSVFISRPKVFQSFLTISNLSQSVRNTPLCGLTTPLFANLCWNFKRKIFFLPFFFPGREGANLKYRKAVKPLMPGAAGVRTKTPLQVASSKGHADVVDFILSVCPDSIDDVSADTQRNALHYACNRKSNVETVVTLIVKGGMDVNKVSMNDWTPLHFAVNSARMDIVKALAAHGGNLYAETGAGGNLLTLASCTKCQEIARWLIDQGISPNCRDRQGLTALHRLSRFGDLGMTKLLVEYGNADVSILDNSGCSALEEADRNNMSEIATYLWTKGCESNIIKNPDGIGPTTWFRLRHINLPSARYGCGLVNIGSELFMFSGLGNGPDFVNHDNENQDLQNASIAIPDSYIADLSQVEHASIVPTGVNPSRPELSLSSANCGQWIHLDSDGLGGWSKPCPEEQHLQASIVKSTKPFKREEKFGYFELHVTNPGELRILTLGLVSEDYPINTKQPGWDTDSYGYHGDDGGCFHNNGAGKAWAERFNIGDVIGCGINFEGVGEIFWTKNGKFLGVSHIGPRSDAYYPAIGVENNGAIFRVNFGKQPFQFSFVVPTLTWNRTPSQPEFKSTNPRLVAMPEVNEILALPDRLAALSSKVYLFNMKTKKWRTHSTIGIRPDIGNYSAHHVRIGNFVYVWVPPVSQEEAISRYLDGARSAALYQLDLETWEWSDRMLYNAIRDDSIDENLNPVESDDDATPRARESDSDDDGDDDNTSISKKLINTEEESARKEKQKQKDSLLSSPSTLTSQNSSETKSSTTNTSLSAATTSAMDTAAESGEKIPKLTLKEQLAARTQQVVELLRDEYASSFVVAMEDDLVFVSDHKMMRMNPKTFEYSTHVLRGERPKITAHSAFAVGSDIVTFGGWDDRKQQNELYIVDTASMTWYKPHTGGLIFPRPRNNHAALYLETSNPTFAVDPDDEENNILAKHPSSMPKWSLPASKSGSKSKISNSNSPSDQQDLTYRFCIFAMGWNGTNTMFDIDFVALDTIKRRETLGKMLEKEDSSGASQSGRIDFDVTLQVTSIEDETVTTSIGAHKAILWARSEYFRALLTPELMNDSGDASSSAETEKISVIPISVVIVEHMQALLRFLYTDNIDVVTLHSTYRQFIKMAEKYAPNHVQRLVAEYLLTKVYEPERLDEELGELLESGAFSDVSLRVDGQIFKAHKVVLCARSAFFRAMLTGGLIETTQEVIDIDDASAPEFSALLRYLYSRSIDYANVSDYILQLFTLAARFEARGLKHTLESLIAFNLDESNVASLLILADQLTADKLKKSAIDFIKKHTDSVSYDNDEQRSQVSKIASL